MRAAIFLVNMSDDKIKTLMSLANKRLNSSEDFEEFQAFSLQVLNLDTVSSIDIFFSYADFYDSKINNIALLVNLINSFNLVLHLKFICI